MENMSINDVLEELRKTYIDGLKGKVETIEHLWKERRYSEIETEFHKLKGTGKTYGLPEVTQVGEVAERLCELGSQSADGVISPANRLLLKIAEARKANTVLDLECEADFLRLREMATEIHETTAGTRNRS